MYIFFYQLCYFLVPFPISLSLSLSRSSIEPRENRQVGQLRPVNEAVASHFRSALAIVVNSTLAEAIVAIAANRPSVNLLSSSNVNPADCRYHERPAYAAGRVKIFQTRSSNDRGARAISGRKKVHTRRVLSYKYQPDKCAGQGASRTILE